MSSKCFSVWFLPERRAVQVAEGMPLLEAAALGGILIEADCGGKGTCGTCLMEVQEATPAGEPREGREPRMMYGCRAVVEGDLLVTALGSVLAGRRRIVTGTSYLVRQNTRLGPDELKPLCRELRIDVPPPSFELCVSDRDRLLKAVAERARVGPEGIDVQLDLDVLRRLPAIVRAEDGRIAVTLWQDQSASVITDIRPGHGPASTLGVACDLGTSTVVLKLLDLDSGKTLGVQSDYNRQIRSGADVISRIDLAARPGGLDRLRDQAVSTIGGLLGRVCRQASIAAESVRAMVISGNTTMTHLVLGVDPQRIREEPYVPAFSSLPSLPARELGFQMHPTARVYCMPAVGSFVGGDIVSGIMCQRRFARPGEIYLFIDVGTNGEIVLGSDEWLLACACSAGPAFEGTGVKCGMRSVPGAIERIALAPDGCVQSYDVIGGGKPRGLCGSALIQLLGDLLRAGVIDRRGRFCSEPAHPRISRFGRTRSYVIERAAETWSGDDIILTESDIDNLIRAKGAIYSASSVLCKKVGIGFPDLHTVYIAGGFGQYLAVEQAVAIGMLPDIPAEKFVFLGNSSLVGATLTLLSTEERDRGLELARAMTYIELSAEPSYMNEYTSALFLPHTDLSQFPGDRLAAGSRRPRGGPSGSDSAP